MSERPKIVFSSNDTPSITEDYLPCARKVFSQHDLMPKIDINSNKVDLKLFTGLNSYFRMGISTGTVSAFLKHSTVSTVTADDRSWFHCNMVWG